METLAIDPTRATAHVLEFLNRRADNPAARAWDSIMRDARYAGANGTARAWFAAHEGVTVHTLQATAHVSGDVYNVWTPGARAVDSSRASFVTLDGSRREYAGLRVEAATSDTLIVATQWGEDSMQVCVYTTRTA